MKGAFLRRILEDPDSGIEKPSSNTEMHDKAAMAAAQRRLTEAESVQLRLDADDDR